MRELKPCPFCGGEAKLMEAKIGSNWWVVTCTHYEDCPINPVGRHVYDTEAEATDAWNTRAERTCEQEERGWGTEGDHARVWLTCGHDCMVPTVQDLPRYCPNCGAQVTEEESE